MNMYQEFADPYKPELTIVKFEDRGLDLEQRAYVSIFTLSDGYRLSSEITKREIEGSREPTAQRFEIDMMRLRQAGVSQENIIKFFQDLGKSQPEPFDKRFKTIIRMEAPPLTLMEGLDLIGKQEQAKRKKPAKELLRSIEI